MEDGDRYQPQGDQQENATDDSTEGKGFIPVEQFSKMQGAFETKWKEAEKRAERAEGLVSNLSNEIADLTDRIDALNNVGSDGTPLPADVLELRTKLKKKERELKGLEDQALLGLQIHDAYKIAKEEGLTDINPLLECKTYQEMQLKAKDLKIKMIEEKKGMPDKETNTDKGGTETKKAVSLDTGKNTAGGGRVRKVTPKEAANMNAKEFVDGIRKGIIQVGQ